VERRRCRVCPRNLPKIRMSEFKVGQHTVWCTLVVRKRTKKIKPEIKLGTTVRLRVLSSEIVKRRVVYLWEEKSVPMVRVASGQLVYNVPAHMLADETKLPT
jgi:hypothetical protein